jgi:hypothetical protein
MLLHHRTVLCPQNRIDPERGKPAVHEIHERSRKKSKVSDLLVWQSQTRSCVRLVCSCIFVSFVDNGLGLSCYITGLFFVLRNRIDPESVKPAVHEIHERSRKKSKVSDLLLYSKAKPGADLEGFVRAFSWRSWTSAFTALKDYSFNNCFLTAAEINQ